MKADIFNINFSQMYYFLQVVDSGSYAEASKNLNVTPSTISKSIQTLEQNLNLQLFFREKKNLSLTDAGKYLYEQWKYIPGNVEESIEQARNYIGGDPKTLRIGTLDSHRSEAYLLDYLEHFSTLCPTCHVCIESAPPQILHRKLQRNEFDLIFTVRYDVETDGWLGYQIKIFEECPLVVCMRPDNPLAQKSELEITDLEQCNLVVISSLHVPSYNTMLTQMCENYGFRPKIIYNTSSANSQIYNIHNPSDVFICDRFHRDYGCRKLVCKTLKNTTSGVALVWNDKNTRKELEVFLSMF